MLFLTALVTSAAVVATVSSEHLTGMTHTLHFDFQMLDKVENRMYDEDSASSSVPLDKNSFFIQNKHKPNDTVALTQTNYGVIESGDYKSGQIFMLEASALFPGFYYIHHAEQPKYRLKRIKPVNVDATDGYVFKNQLWRFQKKGDYYVIYNIEYPTAKLTDYKSQGIILLSPNFTSLARNVIDDDKLWKLIPRFHATAVIDVILTDSNTLSVDKNVTATVKTGLEMVYSHSSTGLDVAFGFEDALKSAVPATTSDGRYIYKGDVNSMIEKSLKMPFSNNAYLNTAQMQFTVPPGKKIEVTQLKITFKEPEPLHMDSCILYCLVQSLIG